MTVGTGLLQNDLEIRKRERLFRFLIARGLSIDAGFSKSDVREFEQFEGRYSEDGSEESDGSVGSSSGSDRGDSPGNGDPSACYLLMRLISISCPDTFIPVSFSLQMV